MTVPSRSFAVFDEYGAVAGEFSTAHSNCILNILEIAEDRMRDVIGFMAHADRIEACLEVIKNPNLHMRTILQKDFHEWIQKRDGLPASPGEAAHVRDDDEVDDAISRCESGPYDEHLMASIKNNIYDIDKVYEYTVYNTPPERGRGDYRDDSSRPWNACFHADTTVDSNAEKKKKGVQIEFMESQETTSLFLQP